MNGYFDTVKVAVVDMATDSIPATVAVGVVFVGISIIIGLLLRSRSMSKSR